MAKLNTLAISNFPSPSALRLDANLLRERQGKVLFNLKSFNSLKKDQTKIKIFKNSSFDSNFNSVQSLKSNLSQVDPRVSLPYGGGGLLRKESISQGTIMRREDILSSPLLRERERGRSTKNIKIPKISAILRAIRTIRLNRDEWKLIRYINQMEKKIRSNPLFGCPSPALATPHRKSDSLSLSLRRGEKRRGTDSPPLAKAVGEGGGLLRKDEKTKYFNIKQNNKIFSFNNIINKNILLRNMKYNFLKSTLSSILKKKIRRISEILEDKPIKNYVLYSYLNLCNFTPLSLRRLASLSKEQATHLNAPALSLTKKLGNGEVALLKEGAVVDPRVSLSKEISEPKQGVACLPYGGEGVLRSKQGRSKLSLNKYKGRKFGSFINYNKIIGYKFNSTFYQAYTNCLAPFAKPALGGGEKSRGNIYIKDIYKLLFYLFKSMYCLISKPVLKYTNDKVTIQLFYYLNIPKKKVFRLFSIFYINSIKKKWLAQSQPKSRSGSGDWLLLSKERVATQERNKTNFIYPPLGSKAPLILGNKATRLGEGVASTPLLTASALEAGTPRLSEEGQGGRGRTYLPRGNTKIYIRWKLRKAISRFKNKYISCPTLSVAVTGSSPQPLLREGGGGDKNLLFKLRKFNLTAKAVFQNKFKLICAILSNKLNKPVELQLIRLHHPYHDSNILVNLLSLNIKNKRKKARVAIQKIYNKKPVKNLNDPNLKKTALPPSLKRGEAELHKQGTGNFIPAFLSGLNIKIAGRLMGEPIIPRITRKVFGKGASATGKVNYLDVARLTKKNRKGAYTIKITSGQNFF